MKPLIFNDLKMPAHPWAGRAGPKNVNCGRALAGVVLIAISRPLATLLSPQGSADLNAPKDLEAALYAMVGVYLVGSAIPELTWMCISLVDARAALPSIDPSPQMGMIFGTVVKIVIGVGLALGARGLATTLQKIRTAGT